MNLYHNWCSIFPNINFWVICPVTAGSVEVEREISHNRVQLQFILLLEGFYPYTQCEPNAQAVSMHEILHALLFVTFLKGKKSIPWLYYHVTSL